MHLSNLGALAAIAALTSATAAMAAATQVNIADPTNVNRKAKVEIGGRLAVQEVDPASFFRSYNFATASDGCVAIAAPPSGKALIVREVRVNVYQDPSPGTGQNAYIDTGACAQRVGDVNPPAVGQTVVPFDPGLTVPAGGVLSADVGGSMGAEFFVDGYVVAGSAVPAVGPAVQMHRMPPQR